MNARVKILAKVAVFGGFILLSCIVGTGSVLNPPLPTRVGDDPYTISMKQLVDYRVQLEGQPVVIMSWTSDVYLNETTGELRFNVSNHFYNITKQVIFKAWDQGSVQRAGSTIKNNIYVVVKGICKILSEDTIEGVELHVLNPDNVYMVSLSGLVVVVAMLFAYFRLDIRRLRFQAKMERGKEHEKGAA
nr:hypothetical protein [Candidatus Sigynarchaeum springense]